MMKSATEDLLWVILIPNFWLSETDLCLNELIQWLRDCLLLIRQCCSICMNSLGSNCSICIGFRICWQVIYEKNKRSMQELCCHFCMLPNETAGIIVWLMMSHGFSIIYYYLACGRYREMMWSQNRDMLFRAKFMFTIIWNPSGFYVIDRLPNDTKMNSAYFVTNILIPIKQMIFHGWRAPHERRLVVHFDNCSVQTNRILTDWLEEHSILHMPHPPYSPDLASIDFYLFPTVKEKLEQIQLADETSFLSACKGFWEAWINKN
jgi:histone-lysine N-methyltransferase SETMAR